jgi:hypothetical protein
MLNQTFQIPEINTQYIPHTSCARIALFSNYKDLSCDECRNFYGHLELGRKKKWYIEFLNRNNVPENEIENCFSRI